MKKAMLGKVISVQESRTVSPSKTAVQMKDKLLGEFKSVHNKIGGKIIAENELKLAQALEENIVLSKVYNDKTLEKDRIFYKYAEAQGQYLEIMRNLTRFRGNFLTKHSLRSKFLDI